LIRKLSALATLGAAIAVIAPASATAWPTGTLTTAEADSAWTKAHVAGSIVEDGKFANSYGQDYPAYLVDWFPVVTVAPSLPAYACQGDETYDSDPNTRVVWVGEKRTAPGTVPFDVSDAAILPGVFGQRACLSEIATVSLQSRDCIAFKLALDPPEDPHTCWFSDAKAMLSVASTTFTQALAPPLAPAAPPPPPAQADTTAPALQLSAATAQKVLRQRGVVVGAASPAEASTVTAKGKVTVRGSAKTFKLEPATKLIPQAGKATLKLKLGKRALAAITRALKAGKRVSAHVTVTARDTAANVTTQRRTIKLKR
jgi:hypothetical protein